VSETESKPLVLLIDDSVDVHRLVKARLRSEPYDIISASTADEGVAVATEQKPTLILLDLDMPGCDGFETLRRLKADSKLCNIAVIIVSGIENSADKVTAFDLGAVDYVCKPIDFGELRARVRSALRTQQLLSLLATRAEVDGLTGLGNRQQFNRRWEQEVSAFQRYGTPLSMIICDIDHFKKINDSFGHPAGDEVLQGFGKVITQSIRATDVACRFGGEEFVVIMPHTGASDAHIVAERIRESLAAVSFPRHPEHRVTVSIGVAGLSGLVPGLTKERWVEFADKALYSAKHGGRNRVVIADMQAGAPTLTPAKAS
jgi:two-component system cell cycle response regulator